MGPHLHIFFKNDNKIKFIGFFTKNYKSYMNPEECISNDAEMKQKVKKLLQKVYFKTFQNCEDRVAIVLQI